MKQAISHRSLHQYFAVFILSILSFSVINAQGQTGSALRDRPSLSISVYQSQHSVSSSFDIDVILTNLTDKAFDIDSVRIFLPESLKSLRPDLREDLSISTQELGAGDEHIYRFGIPSVNDFYRIVLDSETLFFTPGKYTIKAEVILKKSGADKTTQRLHATHELTLQPPLSSVLFGGVFGALLLALFVPAYRALYTKHEHGIQWKDLANQFFIFFVAGSIISVTAILLLHRLGNANLPITVAANDYLGGVIVGLFSYAVGDALYKQFFGKDHSLDLTKEEKPKEVPPTAELGSGADR